MKPLTDHELEHIARLLEIASNQFSNHGCNDYELETTERNVNLYANLQRSLGESEEDIQHIIGRGRDELYVQDWCLMDYLRDRCREAQENPEWAKREAGKEN